MSALNGKVAIVTGGGRGIGRAVVDRFLANGARVLSCGRGERPTDLPEAVVWLQADLSRLEDVKRLRSTALQAFGQVDVLVNNAGVQVEKTVTQTTDAEWDLVMGVNAKAVFLCCRELIPDLGHAGKGVIINLGSISANVSDPSMAIYNASKAFVHGLTRSIAVDHGKDGVRCNAICPGWIMTEMAEAGFDLAANPEAAKRDALARHAVGRFGKPEDVAGLALWLASDDSAYASGQMFVMDGGLTAASPLQPGLF
ncbi:SDR family NAD(P)-dependent oxidoreductase [Marinobacterium rhizophilum]|uniref:SDR family oxidoreductase n=1 Tax=Marinobacterium rhizophilum TaxID=420402 RepID=A0ABY5HMM1_9GAMM|nr:SDR family oxidoreductase [Marinobacterium rhizophilum]UTW13121.1 SDR family oxidoreductase [Marinobacterium rhizophilum]